MELVVYVLEMVYKRDYEFLLCGYLVEFVGMMDVRIWLSDEEVCWFVIGYYSDNLVFIMLML